MNINNFKSKVLPHLIAFVLFLIIALVYFSPYLNGKSLAQNDMVQTLGALKESSDFAKSSGEEILWSNSTFSGMPVWRGAGGNVLNYVNTFLNSIFPNPVLLCLFGFTGFYLLLHVLGLNVWLCFAGAVAYTFSTYNIISIEAGHINKVYDMMLMAPVIAGILLTYRKNMITGAALTIVALGLQIYYAHVQITYYLLIMVLFIVIAEFIYALKSNALKRFFIASAVLAACVVISVAPNLAKLWTMSEYSKATPRGGSELLAKKDQGTGLDKDYALSWSNGIIEPMTILIPSFYGGSSHEQLSTSSTTYKTMVNNGISKSQAKEYIESMPLYWGDQPFTSGPVYFGAIVCFLFVLGLVLVKGPLKWWIIPVTILSIMLSWGKNFEPLTDLFFHYVPLYNKFRSVTMILSIAEITFPLLGFVVLKKIMDSELSKEEIMKGLKIALGVTGGIALFFAILGGAFFDFNGASDAQMPTWIVESLKEDRASALRTDAFRSLFFIAATAGMIWAVTYDKLKQNVFYGLLALLILVDLWTVDKRYLNSKDFKNKEKFEETIFVPSQADNIILQDKDPYFRVFNVTTNPFADAITSYFHKSIGGYSAIKLGRYQDLIDAQLSKNNMAVLNMLNTKYFIVPDKQNNQPAVQRNPGALGNAWAVDSVRIVPNPDEELKALSNFDPSRTAIVDQRFEDYVKDLNLTIDSTASVVLEDYHPNHLTFKSTAQKDQLVVFSDVYYQPGWNAYIDGKPVDHIRVNYILRALKIPAGEHTILFKFEPKSYITGEKISRAGSWILVLSVLGLLGLQIVSTLKKKE
jgi:hypothetical protein